MATLTASPTTFMKLLHKIPDLSEEAVKRTWKMVRHTKKFTSEQKHKLTNALKNNTNIKRRLHSITSRFSDAGRRASRGRASRGRASRGRASRGRASRRRASRGRKTRRR